MGDLGRSALPIDYNQHAWQIVQQGVDYNVTTRKVAAVVVGLRQAMSLTGNLISLVQVCKDNVGERPAW